jgi:hypothetical protein
MKNSLDGHILLNYCTWTFLCACFVKGTNLPNNPKLVKFHTKYLLHSTYRHKNITDTHRTNMIHGNKWLLGLLWSINNPRSCKFLMTLIIRCYGNSKSIISELSPTVTKVIHWKCTYVYTSKYKKGKAIPVTGSGGPYGLSDAEALTFSKHSAHRWWCVCQPYAPAAIYPRKIFGTHWC